LTSDFEELAARDLPAVLVHGQSAAAWPGLVEPAAVEPAPARTSAAAGDGLGRRQMRSAYVAALRILARGEEMAARRAVAELERSVFAADPEAGHATLRRAELKVAAKLEKRDPESLTPLIVLHRNLCHTYTAYRETVLAGHSATVVSRLAGMIGTIRGGPEVGDVAENALVGVALDLVQGVDLVAGGRLLEQTVELDPESIPALENLAALRERTGRRSEAVGLLQTLVTVDQGNLEARLRLGVNLHRSGCPGPARGVLRSLLGNSTPGWIRSIAAQELAHMLVKEGSLDQAESLLIRAIDGTEDRQTLAIQLSWIRDLAGRPAEATATLGQVEGNAERRTDSARLRYCRWPDMTLYGIEDALRRASEDRLDDLRQALDSKELR
jgi:hypothetical protein